MAILASKLELNTGSIPPAVSCMLLVVVLLRWCLYCVYRITLISSLLQAHLHRGQTARSQQMTVSMCVSVCVCVWGGGGGGGGLWIVCVL